MEQKVKQEEGKENIPNLPPSDDEFWNGAKKERMKPKPSSTCEKGMHLFKQTCGREAKCFNCPLGYVLGPGMKVMDGHIYSGNEFVI